LSKIAVHIPTTALLFAQGLRLCVHENNKERRMGAFNESLSSTLLQEEAFMSVKC